MSETTPTESGPLSTAVYVGIFLLFFFILAIFGDLFTFIVGTIGLIIAFAGFYKDSSHSDGHHH
ncbi:hypothetical protein [Dyadobacter sandarakinus]|uniref:Uncharacterized protein n=1 Tax=Dyadobacter sandarakinus TaxID=2747268 RepID=A0ABX7I735_9BACT|nr:hypothetical protein [Dyadobacter sandarakinus]QRR01914.1 hypothetical protein HWI92_13855 [Dyadobacter sandarakinus]